MSDMNVEELAKTVGELVDKQREFHEVLEKKYDGVTAEALEKITKELGDKAAELSDLGIASKAAEKKQVELEEKLDKATSKSEELELLLAASQGSKSGDGPQFDKFDDAITDYMRKGNTFGIIGDMSSADLIKGVGEGLIAKYVKTNDPVLQDMARKDLVVGVNPDGGYFVTPTRGGLIEGRVFETSPLRPLANIVTTTSDMFEYILDDDEADSGWVGEVDTRGDTDSAQVGQILIPVHEIFAQPKATQKMLDDAGFDIAGWHQNKVSDRFSRQENAAFVAGDGSKKPKGFNTYGDAADADVYERGLIGTETTAAAGVIDGDDLKITQGRLKQEYQNSAVWGMKRSTWTTVTLIKDTQDRYLLEMISNLRDGDPLRLLGNTVVLMDDMPTIATDANSIVYADFGRSYTIVDRMGIRILRDPFTSKPFIKFYTTKRVGGDVTNFDAIKRLKIQ